MTKYIFRCIMDKVYCERLPLEKRTIHLYVYVEMSLTLCQLLVIANFYWYLFCFKYNFYFVLFSFVYYLY